MSELALDWEGCHRIASRMRQWGMINAGDGEDFVQDALLEMMERAQRNGGGLSSKEMWQAARCVRNRYWRTYRRGKKACSLNAPIQGTEETIELWETLADKDNDLDAWLDAKARLGELPPHLLRIARKLEKGDPLTQSQRAYLDRFRHDGSPNLQQTWELKRYHDLLSRGLCVSCREESDGSARCPRCRERWRAYQERYRHKKGITRQHVLRAHWRKQGRCPRCGKAPKPGYKICPRCLEKNKEYLRRWKARPRSPEVSGKYDDHQGEMLIPNPCTYTHL